MTASTGDLVVDGLIGSISDGREPELQAEVESSWQRAEDDLLLAADVHGVAPALARYTREHDVATAEARRLLEAARTRQLMRQLSITAEIAPAGNALTESGIDWVVLKGPAVASTLWPSPEMREYHDLDLLIRPDRFSDAIDVLQSAGYRLLDQNWPLISRQFRGELSFLSPRGVVLDVHWSAVNLAALRSRLRWSMNGLLARRRTVAMGSVSAPTLDPVDTLLHLAYHAAHSGAHRLLWLKDVQLATHAVHDQGSTILERAQSARLELILSVVLDRVSALFRDDTVSAVAESLPRSPWRRLVRRRDIATGPLRPFATGGTHRGLFMSTRTTGTTSVIASLGEARVKLQRGRRSDNAVTPERNPLHEVVHDDDARANFLQRVGRSENFRVR